VSESSVQHLVKMANQIAANVPALTAEDRVAATAAHLKRFWTPAMIEHLRAHLREHGEDLSPAAAAALRAL